MRIFITGTAGFIGFHLARLLLEQGHEVHGYDGITDYYDVKLKKHRHDLLHEHKGFVSTEAMLENENALQQAMSRARPSVVIHLAAQAGVRYSIEHPRAYINSNIIGTYNVMEAARIHRIKHLLMASTSSVYGANSQMPFEENDKCDIQVSFYAATKKANEVMSHSWSHLHRVPTTMFRFFTVYGPWGRPDMALFKFTRSILSGETIDVYNYGNMWRDFTYVEDIVRAIALLIDVVPPNSGEELDIKIKGDSLSPVAPWRVVNIGNSDKIKLTEFIDAIERKLGKKAKRNNMPMQQGDVPSTWADTQLLRKLTGYVPKTDIELGVSQFVDWYLKYYNHCD